jgi:hypothetical protein
MKYLVYMEHRVSWAVEVEATTPEDAEKLAYDQTPNPVASQDVDAAGDWETLSITDEQGDEVLPE